MAKSPLQFYTLDVFCDRKFNGNPLAVVLDSDSLTDAEMLAIAREFNLSETVFVLAPRDPVNSARLRIFTPARELPFAGHPTIGAAALLAQLRAEELLASRDVTLMLEENIGLVRCAVLENRAGIVYAQFEMPQAPQKKEAPPSNELLARAFSIEPGDIGFARHAPSIYSAGMPLLFAPIRTRAALDSVTIEPSAFSAATATTSGAYLYTNETIESASAVYARMFPNGLGIAEDAATGAAAAAFAGVAHEFERPEDGDHELFIEQGHKMGRPSRITLQMTVENGQLSDVRVGGQTVRVSQGTLFL
jgi:trans-2,3-dihydro-3-hydroxyanthranilate isomerase